jgi:hypothetical protein
MTSAARLATVLFVTFILSLFSPPAFAEKPITVGNGTPGSCTEAALKNALIIAETVGGATIRFKCGRAPVTIALSNVTTSPGFPVLLVLPNNTTIDGGGLITLSSTFETLAFVDHDTTVVLQNLSIVSVFQGELVAVGVVNFGRLTLRQSTLSGFFSFGVGGIFNDGTLTIVDSVISGNASVFFTGGIDNRGTLSLQHTTISQNFSTQLGGGGIFNRGTMTVDHSTFSENRNGDGDAGGILNAGTLTIDHSAFADNSASLHGGAILNFGTLIVNHSTFSNNSAGLLNGQIGGGVGGGIFNSGDLTVNQSTFSGNAAAGGGGIFTGPDAFASLRHSEFSENVATQGGGIFNGGTLEIDHGTVSNNTASSGGGIYICVDGQDIPPIFFATFPRACHGTLTITHTSVTENTPDDIFP